MLQLTEEDFVRVTAETPPRPLNMTSILATNRGLDDYAWVQVKTGGTVPSVRTSEAPTWLQERSACVLDVREPWSTRPSTSPPPSRFRRLSLPSGWPKYQRRKGCSWCAAAAPARCEPLNFSRRLGTTGLRTSREERSAGLVPASPSSLDRQHHRMMPVRILDADEHDSRST
jgi:hypothetical protein